MISPSRHETVRLDCERVRVHVKGNLCDDAGRIGSFAYMYSRLFDDLSSEGAT